MKRLSVSGHFQAIKIVYFQRYMELAFILIILLAVNVLHARFILQFQYHKLLFLPKSNFSNGKRQ